RLPAGAFFNGFGLGAGHTLPLGVAMPMPKPAAAIQAGAPSAPHAAVQQGGLAGNAMALFVSIAPNALKPALGTTDSSLAHASNDPVANSDIAPPLDNHATISSAGTLQLPGSALPPPAGSNGTASGGGARPTSGGAPAPIQPASKPNDDAVLYQ